MNEHYLVYLLPFVLQYSPHLWYGLDALTQSGLISPVGSAFMTAFPFLESENKQIYRKP